MCIYDCEYLNNACYGITAEARETNNLELVKLIVLGIYI